MDTNSNIMKIKAIMQHYGLNQTKMAAALGIPQTNLSAMLTGKRACGDGIIAKVQLNFPEINTQWLLSNDTEMIRKNNSTISGDITIRGNGNSNIGHGNTYTGSHNNNNDVIEVETEEVERAPILSGTLARAPQTDILEVVTENVDEFEKSPIGVFHSPVSLWYRVQDESLTPKYEIGDLIALWAYPKGEEDPIPGKMYGINTTSNGLIIRKLYPQDDGGYIARALDRDEFPDYYIKSSNVVQIYKIIVMVRY